MLLIARIDSGVTFALALINLEQEIIYLGSGRELEKSALNICLKKGKVIAVTTDKKESRKARKFAASLSAELVLPKKNLSRRKKNILVKDYKDLKLNSHEKCSLASAISTYKKYKQKLKRFEDEIGHVPLEVKEEFILSGKRISCFK